MTSPHPIENIMRTTMEQLRQMSDVNTIVGEPVIAADGTMILPISKISTGFVSGGGEYAKGESIHKRKDDMEIVEDVRHPFAGGSAAGISLTPKAFLVVGNGSVNVLPAEAGSTIDRLVEMAPRAIEELRKSIEKIAQSKREKEAQNASMAAQAATSQPPVPPAPPTPNPADNTAMG